MTENESVLRRRIEEKLNSLEIEANNLQRNIAYARNELFKVTDKSEKEIEKYEKKISALMDFISEHDLDEVEELLDKIDEEEDD